MFPEVTTGKTTQYIATNQQKKKATSVELKYYLGMSRSLLKERMRHICQTHMSFTQVCRNVCV